MRSLIVEPDPLAAKACRQILFIPSTICTSGEEAVALVEEQGQRFDVVLTSIILGHEEDQLVMNGLDVYDRLAIQGHGNKVIFLNDAGLASEVQATLDALPNTKLPKPVVSADLRSAFLAIRNA